MDDEQFDPEEDEEEELGPDGMPKRKQATDDGDEEEGSDGVDNADDNDFI